MSAWLALLLVACESPPPLDLGEPPAELELPDLEGVDLPAVFVDAALAALGIDGRAPWAARAASLTHAKPACPDYWAGLPDFVDDRGREAEGGVSWGDHCLTNAGQRFSGWMHWESEANGVGFAEDPAGRTETGARTLRGDGSVAEAEVSRLLWRGEATDSLTRTVGPGYEAWSYGSLVQGSLGGDDLDLGRGYRADLYQRSTGGDARTLELRGNVYWFERRLQARFDSVRVDIAWAAPEDIAGEACALEPAGYISVRTEDAYWFDLVFGPTRTTGATAGYPDAPYTECDGCGVLYVRGIEQPEQVCPDLSALWAEGVLSPPPVQDFVTTARDVLGGAE